MQPGLLRIVALPIRLGIPLIYLLHVCRCHFFCPCLPVFACACSTTRSTTREGEDTRRNSKTATLGRNRLQAAGSAYPDCIGEPAAVDRPPDTQYSVCSCVNNKSGSAQVAGQALHSTRTSALEVQIICLLAVVGVCVACPLLSTLYTNQEC